MYEIKVQGEFDAAHFLEGTNTQCDNLHGHRWVVWVTLQSENLSPTGWVINFSVVKKWLKDILERFDHNVLNYYLDQPTAENLCYVIYRHIHSKLIEYNVDREMRACLNCDVPFESSVWEKKKFHSKKCANIYSGKNRKKKNIKPNSKIISDVPIKMDVELKKIEIAETPGNIAAYSCSDVDVRHESLKRGRRKFFQDSEKSAPLRKKMSKDSRARWADPEKRQEMVEKILEANQDPEQRRKKSERMLLNNPMKNRRNVEKMIASLRKSQKLSPNKEEQKIIEFMKKNTLAFLFVGDGSYIVDGKIPDFINKSKRIVVEYNNRFWHCNDNPWYDVKDDSEERRKFFEERGYKFYIIWNDEFEMDKEKIKVELKRLLED